MTRGRQAAAMAAILGAAVCIGLIIHWISGPSRRPGPGVVPSSAATEGEVASVDLYFADEMGNRLALERREVLNGSQEEMMRRIIEELAKGPVEKDLIPTLPKSVGVRGMFFRDGVAFADLTAGASDGYPGGVWTEVLAVWSIVDSLCGNFSSVRAVQILVEGQEAQTLAGHVDISRPLDPRPQLLAGEW